MHAVQIMADDWKFAWGLGIELKRAGDRLLAGHSGGMPGHITAFTYSRRDGIAAAVLANAYAPSDEAAEGLALAAVKALPSEQEPWRPEAEPVPERIAGILGRWFSEGEETIFSWRAGRLEAWRATDSGDEDPSVFAEEAPDRFRVASGRERGGAAGRPQRGRRRRQALLGDLPLQARALHVRGAVMPHWICRACAMQYPESTEPPSACPVCEDERQYVPDEGQRWTTLNELRERHRPELRELEPGLLGIGMDPRLRSASGHST